MTALTRWRTDDPCPVCGTSLITTDDADSQQTGQDCPLCGWSVIWQAAVDTIKEG
jgi:predicted RNA-binding Zn-ribbon protein involved in translation (DUF1610 family)